MSTNQNANLQPTSSELAILQILWQRGPSTVREVQGQNHIYEAAIAQETTQTALLDTFLHRAFGGSAWRLVMKALGNYEASPEELEQLKKAIAEKENKKPEDHD